MMKPTYLLTLLIGLALAFSLPSCDQNQPETKVEVKPEPDFDFGRVDNMGYSNRLLGIKMKTPWGWHVKTREELEDMSPSRDKVFEYGMLRRPTKIPEVKYAELYFAQRDTGTTVKLGYGGIRQLNPFVAIEVENPDTLKGVKDLKRYIRMALNDVQITPEGYTVADSGREVTINGHKMYKLHEVTDSYYDMFNRGIIDYYLFVAGNFYVVITIVHEEDDYRIIDVGGIIRGLTFMDADTTDKAAGKQLNKQVPK